ncbi:autotransporter outer membrane beta-barrel domain-containing protein [Pseudomonas tolaasii]|uniref:autotransporter outer membrane beta-barrel domain-containing protein n=1 Tax=Pseudomonas tolaasii TaxID=29442 RepID=UPI001C56CD08|nr:autotransporter outer membrane beta-barrel domain-containing protein [Pseudomonas tolaasii]MBW1245183.1 autotransporter outer membrane beta-barrel domain-containing protein [Pseudomonas tolaasii]
MPFTRHTIALVISLAATACLQQAQARAPYSPPESYDLFDEDWLYTPTTQAAPIDGSLTPKATTHNGLQAARVLEPALSRLLQSGQLSSEQVKSLEKMAAQLNQQPGGMGAALEQLAGSQHANLAAATQNTTRQIAQHLLSTLRTLPDDDDGHFWVQGLSNDGSLKAGPKYGTQGLMLGADWALDHAWRAGVIGAKSTSKLDAQRFAAELDSWHLGGYAVRRDGPLALRLGALYSNHGGQNTRNVELPGHKDTLKSTYDASSQTLFSELGYHLGDADLSIEPFAGLGYQRYHRDRFKENGGVTALNVGPQTQQNLSSTLGLRLATVYRFDHRMSLTPHISTSWKHLYGNVDSQVRQSFNHAALRSDEFTINGTALDRNSLNLQAGLDLALSTEHSLGLAYNAEKGSHSSSHGLMGQWQMRF